MNNQLINYSWRILVCTRNEVYQRLGGHDAAWCSTMLLVALEYSLNLLEAWVDCLQKAARKLSRKFKEYGHKERTPYPPPADPFLTWSGLVFTPQIRIICRRFEYLNTVQSRHLWAFKTLGLLHLTLSGNFVVTQGNFECGISYEIRRLFSLPACEAGGTRGPAVVSMWAKQEKSPANNELAKKTPETIGSLSWICLMISVQLLRLEGAVFG